MTNEEAIKTLEANYPDACFEQLREAVDAAIEALKAQDADSDTISRKAAIRWVKTECNPYGKSTLDFESGKKVIEHLEQLPPAQPTLYGYNMEHLVLIATLLQKENLPPDRVGEAIADIGGIVSIVRAEFEEELQKSIERWMIEWEKR